MPGKAIEHVKTTKPGSTPTEAERRNFNPEELGRLGRSPLYAKGSGHGLISNAGDPSGAPGDPLGYIPTRGKRRKA